MGGTAPGLTFALIGHLETWQKIGRVVAALRGPERNALSDEDIRSIVPWIPPRTVVRVRTASHPSGHTAEGVYIDTFITPDDLRDSGLRGNIARVVDAARYAIREGASVASLGGFASIVLEGDTARLPDGPTRFTTGNSLTVAYIVKGIEAALSLDGRTIEDCTLLVIGSTGDIGSGCIAYFGSRARRTLLCARSLPRLQAQHAALTRDGIDCVYATDAGALLPQADCVIFAASVGAPAFPLDSCKPGALVCDAGYPKNSVEAQEQPNGVRLFFGGMGRALGGYTFTPDLRSAFYSYPLPGIGHGCMFEGMLLALDGRAESYSQGRGRISLERIEEIWAMARRHGYVLAPLFNDAGLWPRQPDSITMEMTS